MLKAAVKMLESPLNKSKIECAKNVLDEIIANLENLPKSKTFEFQQYGPKGIMDSPSDNDELSEEAEEARKELQS